MASSKAAEEDEITRCSICFEVFNKPKYLPCLHTFCETCLSEYITSSLKQSTSNSDESPSSEFPCPICRTSVSSPDSSTKPEDWASKFPINHLIITLLDQKKLALKDKCCDPCLMMEEQSTAVSWCTTCNEALCKFCEKCHRSMKMTRNHKIVPLNEIKSETKSITTLQFCEYHDEEKLKFYCMDHETPCCAICVTVHHRKCEHVKTLDEVAKGIQDKPDLNNLSESLRELIKELTLLLEDRKNNLQDIEREKTKYQDEISRMRQDVNTHLDVLEETLNRELSSVHKECEISIENDKDEIENSLKIISNCQTVLKTSVKQVSDIHVFLEMNKLRKQRHERSEILKNRLKEIKRHNIELKFEENWMNLISSITKMGTVVKSSIPVKIGTGIFQGKTSNRNFEKCIAKEVNRFSIGIFISGGIFLSEDRMLLVDCNGRKIIFSNVHGTVQKELPLSGRPWDIVQINDNEAAVILQNTKNIQFIDIVNMVLGKLVTVNQTLYRGIGYNGTHFIVGQSRNLYIVSTNGDILQTMPAPTSNNAEYITTTKDKILYSSSGSSVLYCFGMDWSHIFSYSNTGLSGVKGIALDQEGNIYCCGHFSGEVHQLTPDGQLITVILTNMTYPCGIQFDKNGDRFLVTHNRNNITIYELTES